MLSKTKAVCLAALLSSCGQPLGDAAHLHQDAPLPTGTAWRAVDHCEGAGSRSDSYSECRDRHIIFNAAASPATDPVLLSLPFRLHFSGLFDCKSSAPITAEWSAGAEYGSIIAASPAALFSEEVIVPYQGVDLLFEVKIPPSTEVDRTCQLKLGSHYMLVDVRSLSAYAVNIRRAAATFKRLAALSATAQTGSVLGEVAAALIELDEAVEAGARGATKVFLRDLIASVGKQEEAVTQACPAGPTDSSEPCKAAKTAATAEFSKRLSELGIRKQAVIDFSGAEFHRTPREEAATRTHLQSIITDLLPL